MSGRPVHKRITRSRMLDFSFKPFEEMTAEDYATVGFKAGLEVHQQLLTRRKLFCRCPTGRYDKTYHAEILRHMRPTLSELGEYDGTALMEFKTRKEIIYRINKETVCTYEMDDTPPFMMDEEALDISIEICLMAGLTVVDEVHIARKQYLDGSIPTGFQRTAIIGLNGSVPFGEREIGISHLSLEEDSCREISDVGHRRTYITDRLGMPLIELVTHPDMRTPREVEKVANLLRRMMRTTTHVRRGPGSTRADTNVSVEGGTRAEIKGVCRTSLMPLLTYNEARRQWNLLRLREELHRRGITEDTFQSQSADVTRIVRKTLYTPIEQAVAANQVIKAVRLVNWAELLRWEVQTATFFSRELSDRVRVIACLTTLPNIIHSDNPSENISAAEWKEIKRAVEATEDDAVVLVWGDEQDTETAVQEIVIRAREATIGVPSETRQALRDGTTGFERILPGPDRMYPDTDLPPITIHRERVERMRANLTMPFWERVRFYQKLGVPEGYITRLAISRYAPLFREAVERMALDPVLASYALYQVPKELERKGYAVNRVSIETVRDLLLSIAEGKLVREGIPDAWKKALAGSFSREQLPPPLSDDELNNIIKKATAAVRSNKMFDESNIPVLTIAEVMKSVRGRIPGRIVVEKIKTR